MKVYFSANHREFAKRKAEYRKIQNAIHETGGILTVSWLETYALRAPKPIEEWVSVCGDAATGIELADIVIVEASGRSAFGNGYEVGRALRSGKRVLILIAENEKDDSYASGINEDNVTVLAYTPENVASKVRGYMQEHSR